MKTITSGSDFSGVGAFDYAIERVARDKGFKHERIFACDWDKYARITYAHNHGEPKYYPYDVYERETPKKPLDIYMTSPPCQSFSLAGKRGGKKDSRGILFFNSHEFIKENKPRFFIFENVKGLLSDDNGNTFQEWINYLAGKSVNGAPIIFPYESSLPYHVYYKVLNSKKHGVPQNRERVFIVGIRDDKDNNFRWPREEFLEKRLKDVLETEVDEKYFLSEKMVGKLITYNDRQKQNGNGFSSKFRDVNEVKIIDTIKVGGGGQDDLIKVGFINQNTQASQVISENGISSTLSAGTHGYAQGYIKIKSATEKGYETATENDSINFSVPNSLTRRGRVGKGVAQTLDTGCQQGVVQLNTSKESGGKQPYQQNRVYSINGLSPCLDTDSGRRNILSDYRIRRLTPRECFRLQDFPEKFDFSCVSNSQAYKQAGNSITVGVLEKILTKLL